MKVIAIVNGLTVDGTEHVRGDKFDVDDKEGQRLITRGLVIEVKGRKTPVTEPAPEGNRGGGK